LKQFDVVVVGAGLVGASLAAALGQNSQTQSLSIALVDAGKPSTAPQNSHQSQPEPQFDPRVVALTRRSQALLENIGIWSAVASPSPGLHPACPYSHMQVWDGEGTSQIDFDSGDLQQENLGYIVENRQVLSHLISKIEALPQIEQFWGETVTALEESENQSHLRLNSGLVISAPLILAADGANSHIRKLRGFATREWQYRQHAIVTTVKTEKSHGFTARQRFMKSGPLAFLPLLSAAGDDYFSSIVWSLDEERAATIEALNDSEFKTALTDNFEARLGRVTWTDKRFSFPLQQRHAKAYVQPGIALLGDAAHTIHPLAGQGVNLGFMDVEALVSELERAVRREIPLTDFSILRRYQRARLGPNLAMMALMEGFKQMFGSRNAWVQVLRNTGISTVDQLGPLRNLLAKRAMGL